MTAIQSAISNKNLYELTQAITASQSPTQIKEGLDQAVAARDSASTNILLKALFNVETTTDFDSSQFKTLKKEYELLHGTIRQKMPTPTFLTPKLHQAAFTGSLQKADSKLLDSKDGKGLTPLHYAIAGKQKETVRFLLEHADLQYRTADNESYLHFAAMTGDREIFDLLFEKEIDPTIQSREHHTAAHYWAATSDDLDRLNLLAGKGCVLQTSLAKLTPLAIVILKALVKNPPLLSSIDFKLFVLNALQLNAAMGMQQTSNGYYTPFNVAGYVGSFFQHSVLELCKRVVIKSLIPVYQPNVRAMVSPTACFFSTIVDRTADLSGTYRPLESISSAVTTAVVADHAMKALQSKTTPLWKKIIAAPIHLFNTGSALFHTATTAMPSLLSNPNFTTKIASDIQTDLANFGNFLSKGAEDTYPPLDPEDYKTMSLLDRLKDETLTAHLQNSTGSPRIQYEQILLNPDKDPSTCEEIKKLYRKHSLKAHPDKGGNTAASQTLNAAYANLKQAYLCKM